LIHSSEDIDLLLSWSSDDCDRLILIEAKAFGSFANKQLTSKLKRLESIFGFQGDNFERVRPTFVLTGFSAPVKLRTEAWPPWALADGMPRFLRMPPPSEPQFMVSRCDESGVPAALGKHWRYVKR